MLSRLFSIVLCCSLFVAMPCAEIVACPMCKAANEADQANVDANAKPRAYMYSIMFMISMPATILSGFGFVFWRMNRSQNNASAIEASMPEFQ